MKKIAFIVVAVLLLFGCNKKETIPGAKNYKPEIPKLSSDIMTPEVLWSFGRLGEAQVSPDGKTVLYTVSYYNIEENKSYCDIYSIPVSGGEPKILTNTAVKEFNVAWRPDGKRIGFLSSASGTVQLWEMNPNGNKPKQISDIPDGIQDSVIRPTSQKYSI